MKKFVSAMLFMTYFLAADAKAIQLKFLSWNVFMIPKPVNFSLQQPRAHLIGPLLRDSDYDVIFLQEVFNTTPKFIIADYLKKNFPHQDELGKWRGRPWKILSSGNFVASRYPFKVLDWNFYDSCFTADCFASKGVLLIELSLPQGKKAQVAMSHLQAMDLPLTRSIREQQLLQIRELLTRYRKPNIPQFLVGDLNIDANNIDEYEKALAVLGMESAPLQGELDHTSGFRVDCYKTPGTENNGKWIDHVWIRPNESSARVLERRVRAYSGPLAGIDCPLSDHYGLEAIVEL
jgi:endonuclease/exonuclease/phosphatase family metal-dependent hydrolase